jgi:2-octaprenyl-6-methoxyphenol hydroxylase
VRDEQLDDVLSLSDDEFLDRLQQRFGQRLGRFLKAGKRKAYPLSMLKAEEHVRSRVALIGNAAHTLHPVAGQGFNLGMRDVAVLAELLVKAINEGQDPGDLYVLQEYADWRRRDHRRVIAFTDGLARIFSNPLTPVKIARNLGLVAVDLMPFVKHGLSRQTMGMTGRLSKLARGLPLA